MPKVVFTHPVTDLGHWLSKHDERVEIFSDWGSAVVDYVSADGSNHVSVGVDVHDMDAMKAALETDEMQTAKESHGVLEPLMMFVQSDGE